MGRLAQSQTDDEPRQPTLLVVEDDVLIRSVLAEYLRMAGYRVIEAANAAEAIAVLDAGTAIDLALSDIAMPGAIDGLGLAEWVRAHHRHIPVVLTSGNVDQAAAEVADAFFRKPYRMSTLTRRIGALLNKPKA